MEGGILVPVAQAKGAIRVIDKLFVHAVGCTITVAQALIGGGGDRCSKESHESG